MDMTEFHLLRHKVNEAATKMDAELGAARASNPPVDGNPHVQAAHAALGDLDKALIALDAWGKRQEAPPVEPPSPGLPPPTPVQPRADGDLGDLEPSSGVHTFIGAPNTPYWFRVPKGGNNASFQAGAGADAWCEMAAGDAPQAGTRTGGKGQVTIWQVTPGQYVTMWVTTGGPVEFRYSIQKYAPQ